MVVLVSTYELGRPAFGPAVAAAYLRDAGVAAHLADVSRGPLPADLVQRGTLFAVHVPMHAATRLAGPVLSRLRAERPDTPRVAFGLYAPLNASWLRTHGATHVLGVEAEAALAALAAGTPVAGTDARGTRIPRLAYAVPDRSSQLPLSAYAHLTVGGEHRLAGYTEASRGCLHTCTHCPIVPIYQGAMRVVPVEVVLADVGQQVAAGAQHITFGDPDFLNGPRHAGRVLEGLASRYPDVSYDVTVKVEHLLAHPALLDLMAGTRCAFITSAVESFDDRILLRLQKGHTAEDARQAIAMCRARGVALVPTFVAFTPWTTLAGYLAWLDEIEALSLVDAVAPVQLALRLLLPAGSGLLADEDVRRVSSPFDEASLAHPWVHDSPAVDRLQADLMTWLGTHGRRASRPAAFDAARRLAADAAGKRHHACAPDDVLVRATVPYLDEPWYC